MAQFFNYYPKTFYSSNAKTSGVDTVTNIITRFSFEDSLKQNSAAFYKYTVKDSDTPEIIADKFYGDSERHWIVLLFNDIIDPQFDWPLQYPTFIEYVDTKYTANGAANTTVQTGLEWAQDVNNVQSYYKVITRTGSTGEQIEERIRVDANTYANVGTSTTSYALQDGSTITETITTETKTYYEHENELNEAKREIKLLKQDFVTEVEKEFKRVIR
jgi:hypothetical protein